MRKINNSVESVKTFINELKGKNLKIAINKGRKKVAKYFGTIDEVFPQIFTLKIKNERHIDTLSCSYNDVICGDVILREAE